MYEQRNVSQHSIGKWSESLDDYKSKIAEFKLPLVGVGKKIVIEKGHILNLSSDPEMNSIVEPHRVVANDVDDFKGWMMSPGTSLELASNDDGLGINTPLNFKHDERVDDLVLSYLQGRSKTLERDRRRINKEASPFSAMVYVVDKLTIEAGAKLIVMGQPAILLVRHLVIEDGGQLHFSTLCNATIGCLEKIKSLTLAH
jgi:hypothetical protein